MKKVLFFLLLMTAVIGRAQTSLDLLPVGTVAPDFTVTNSKTGEKVFHLSDCKNKTSKDGKAVKGVFNLNGQRISNNADTTGLPAGMYIVNGKKCIVK